jgi:transposase
MGWGCAELRREADRLPRSGRQGRRVYTEGFRGRVAEYVKARREAGVAWGAISAELELPFSTLAYWLRGRPRERGFRVVRMALSQGLTEPAAERPRERSATLVTPRGYRVEGLAVAELVELLRALA